MSKYDIAVLGAGPGGYVAAIRAAQYGAKVCLIEKDLLGGTCLNRGCIPSKALLESVHSLEILRQAGAYGLACDNPRFDLAAVYGRKDRIVEKLRNGIAALLKKNKVAAIAGRGLLKSAGVIEVESREGKMEIVADRLILATGSAPQHPAAWPLDGENVADSDHFLALQRLPTSAVVIGGGYIGCELGSIIHGFGCRTTIIELLPRLLPNADEDVAKEISRAFKKKGIEVMTDTAVEKIEASKQGEVTVTAGGKNLVCEKVLVAVGRKPCTAGLGLENAGIKTDEKGFVPVNEYCQTTTPTVYAIGDITGKAQLAHAASQMGLTAAAHATGHRQRFLETVMPACVFSHPEIGSVGLTEAEARNRGHEVKCHRFSCAALGKALAMNQGEGFFKIVAEQKSGKVLGVHIVAAHASDLIAEAALALRLECTVEELAATIHAHPTLAEGLKECAEGWLGMGIHG